MKFDRRETAYRVRVEAAAQAKNRDHPKHKANPDEQRYATAHYPMSFTKGLAHDKKLGLVNDTAHFEAFRTAIDEGFIEPFTTRVPVPTCKNGRRKWEAPTAGVVYDLEGPDAQAVTMPPAPELCSNELAFEMAEVYELALLRDEPFHNFANSAASQSLQASIDRLNKLPFAKNGFHENPCGPVDRAGRAGRPRKTEAGKSGCEITAQTAFRGSSPGVEVGPYLSQFMLIGNGNLADGKIGYGAQSIDQRVPGAPKDDDYMKTWNAWLEVQNGCNVNGCGSGQNLSEPARFISKPRDLATYVHFDALYQAYLNATLILLGMGTPFDPGFAKLSGMRDVFNPVGNSQIKQNAGGFALYGGPHILTLVTEVATRALKAVRFQKFNNHLRLRPEALAARLAKADQIDKHHPSTCGAFTKMCDELQHTLKAVAKVNPADKKNFSKGNFLLPMAFQEGSPMHPTYGAGHATVAGACTTIVKAFFDTSTVLGLNDDKGDACRCGKAEGFYRDISKPVAYEPEKTGKKLKPTKPPCPLTLEGELNKLAANISIGRNMAGVHYFSDYYDSLRMGEEIAIGMLEEQALCYPTDDFVMSVPTFDGDTVRIGRR